jgi:hypothetical protein
MLFGQNRDELRRFYVATWRKYREALPLQPLEALICEVIALHPEYHAMLEDEEQAVSQEFSPEAGQSNPFLHMGMHIGIREQLSTNRPPGIVAAYEALLKRLGDRHEAEHRMMECLGQAMWEAQRSGMPPDEGAYLECVNRL